MAISEKRTQIYLKNEQHEKLKEAASDRRISMAQVVREAVTEYLGVGAERRADPLQNDALYEADPAWSLLDAADEIGGSETGADATKLEDELYGPAEKGAA